MGTREATSLEDMLMLFLEETNSQQSNLALNPEKYDSTVYDGGTMPFCQVTYGEELSQTVSSRLHLPGAHRP